MTDLIEIQIASVGSFKGHPAGPFELTPQTFAECVNNWKAGGCLPIQVDFDHSSEQEPTAGNIPISGCPAQGWVHKLFNRGAAGLFGLAEWLEPLKTYIKEGKYRYLSPAIVFGSKDRISGKPCGARLSSVAAVNAPFLRDLPPLTARDGIGTMTVRMTDSVGRVGIATAEASATNLIDLTRILMAHAGLSFSDAMVEAAVRLKHGGRR